MPESTDVLCSTQVAELLLCTEEQVELLTRQRALPGLKFGRGWVYPKAALLHVLNQSAISLMGTPVVPNPETHPASAARAAVVPQGVELLPRNRRQQPPTLSVVSSTEPESA